MLLQYRLYLLHPAGVEGPHQGDGGRQKHEDVDVVAPGHVGADLPLLAGGQVEGRKPVEVAAEHTVVAGLLRVNRGALQ